MRKITETRTGKIVSDTDLKLEYLYRKTPKKDYTSLCCNMNLAMY